MICASAEGAAGDAASAHPVLLVPGYKGSPADFDVLKRALVRAGYDEQRVRAMDLPNSWGSSNIDNAAAIEKAVRALSQKWNRRVVVIAHSMGGLAARYSVKFLAGSLSVETVVMLGTMNGGLPPGGLGSPCSAPFGVIRYYEELCADGDFIAALNSGRRVHESPPLINIFSTSDEIVSESSAFLPGAENIEVKGVTHSGPTGYLESPAVLGLLLERLRSYLALNG